MPRTNLTAKLLQDQVAEASNVAAKEMSDVLYPENVYRKTGFVTVITTVVIFLTRATAVSNANQIQTLKKKNPHRSLSQLNNTFPFTGTSQNCTDDQFECRNGLCVQRAWLCDGENDCKDFSDEINCTKKM